MDFPRAVSSKPYTSLKGRYNFLPKVVATNNQAGLLFLWKAGVRSAADQTVLNCAAHIQGDRGNVFFGLKGTYIVSMVVKNCLLNKYLTC